MGLAVINWLPSEAAPWTYWLWAMGALFAAGGLGFAFGAVYSWFSSRSRIKRAYGRQADLLPMVRENLEAAFEATQALKECQQLVLSEEDTADLSSRRDALLETLGEIVELQQQVAQVISGKPPAPAGSFPFEIEWIREPADELTKTPDASALELNLTAMLAKGTEHNRSSGFLFVKLDWYEKLAERFGVEGLEVLLRKFAGVIIRAAREEDLVCRYDENTFGVLLPSLEPDLGPTLARAIRDSIRHHHFRLSESGQEVYITASLGYTDCHPHENEDLVLNRAGNALAKSERRGRNQLHLHDGEQINHFVSE